MKKQLFRINYNPEGKKLSVEVKGYPLAVPEYLEKLFVWKLTDDVPDLVKGPWQVTDVYTGCHGASGRTRKKAIEAFVKRVNMYSKEELKKVIKETRDLVGHVYERPLADWDGHIFLTYEDVKKWDDKTLERRYNVLRKKYGGLYTRSNVDKLPLYLQCEINSILDVRNERKHK